MGDPMTKPGDVTIARLVGTVREFGAGSMKLVGRDTAPSGAPWRCACGAERPGRRTKR